MVSEKKSEVHTLTQSTHAHHLPPECLYYLKLYFTPRSRVTRLYIARVGLFFGGGGSTEGSAASSTASFSCGSTTNLPSSRTTAAPSSRSRSTVPALPLSAPTTTRTLSPGAAAVAVAAATASAASAAPAASAASAASAVGAPPAVSDRMMVPAARARVATQRRAVCCHRPGQGPG